MNVQSPLNNLKRILQFVRVSIHDLLRYLQYSSLLPWAAEAEALEAKLTILAHAIEKGFALPCPKRAFGQDKLREMLSLHRILEQLRPASESLCFSLGVLREYIASDHIEGLPPKLLKELRVFVQDRSTCKSEGGVLSCSRDQVVGSIPESIDQFFYSRHSVRDYAERPVSRKDVFKAIKLAQCSPSVCNRQPSKVYVVESAEMKQEVLSHQNGNEGFGEYAGLLMIVTVSLHSFHGPLERNEAFVDGGMFAMSLIWALHSLGLGSCALNWCATPVQEKGLRQAAKIPHSEVIIMQVAVGHLKESYLVAQSPRRPTKQIVEFVDFK